MSQIDVFASKLGVRILPTKQRRRRRGETHARRLLRNLHAERGEGHLSIVLKAIMSSDANAHELWSETIGAVSDVLTAFPEIEDRGGMLLDQFEAIDLSGLRERAKALAPIGIHTRQSMTVMLAEALRPPER